MNPIAQAQDEPAVTKEAASSQDRGPRFRVFGLIALAVILLQVALGASIFLLLPWAERGLFGDMWGGINTLFSGLAFAGIIYAIFLQREELLLQRRELELTREELARTALASEQTARLIAEQSSLLRLREERAKEAVFIVEGKGHPDEQDGRLVRRLTLRNAGAVAVLPNWVLHPDWDQFEDLIDVDFDVASVDREKTAQLQVATRQRPVELAAGWPLALAYWGGDGRYRMDDYVYDEAKGELVRASYPDDYS